MLIVKQLIAWVGLVALLFGLVMLVALIALGGGIILNELMHLGRVPATLLFLGSAGVCSLVMGLVFINDHLRKISWISQEDDDWELDEEDPDEIELDEPKMPTVGRNQPCPCGSGKKYKRCCLRQRESQYTELNDIPV
jgi:hypothetical protein